MHGPNIVYYVVLAYIIYIIGLTAIPIIKLFFEYLNKVKTSKEFKYPKKCNLCQWVKSRLFIPKKPKEQLSLACFMTGLGSVLVSAFVMMYASWSPESPNVLYNQVLALFVGLWAPNLIILSLYLKK